MADPREVFWSLQDQDAIGDAAHVRVEGDAAADQKGAIGFAFKDSDSNVILPQLDAAGQIPVAINPGTALRSIGELVAGSLTLAAVTNAEITLTIDKKYNNVAMVCACRRDSLVQLIQSDATVETVIGEVILGAGQYSFMFALPQDTITAGSTGAQKLLVKGMNFDKLSSLRATISCMEMPV